MWTWFNCYLSGRHQYGMWCEPGTIFLRCVHCGRRSSGWTVQGRQTDAGRRRLKGLRARLRPHENGPRVLPFSRRAAS
jgi:hypothetical protein